MKKYVNICCATFVLQKVSFKTQDTVNMFVKMYVQQLEQILHFFKRVYFCKDENKDSRESRWIMADFTLSNLISQDEYHSCPAQNGNMTGTLGHAIHTAYAKCRFARRQLTHSNINRFHLTIRQITHICGIVKQIKKNAAKFVFHITQLSAL